MDCLIKKIDFILIELGEIKRKCDRMDKHIDVVELLIGKNLRTCSSDHPLDNVV